MTEREEELREALGLAEDGTALAPRDPAAAAALLDNPSSPRPLRTRPPIEDT